jgi:hypothetical protein
VESDPWLAHQHHPNSPKGSQSYVHVSEASPTVFENNAIFMAINDLKPLENI